jgi:hypothetical protein
MNLRLGMYDIFSRILPGGFYLLAFLQLSTAMGFVKFTWATLGDIGVIPSLGLLVIAYAIGAALDPFGAAWHRLFRKQGMSNRVLQAFKERNADHWKLDFKDTDWRVLRAYIGIHNPDTADEIDRLNALCIMFRNISLGITLIAVSEIIQSAKTLNWIHGLVVVLLIALSILTARQATTLRDWFYSGIYETILAYRLDLEERVTAVKTSPKRKNEL